MRLSNKKMLWAALLLWMPAFPLSADEFSLTTEKEAGANISVALNSGVEATLIWDEDESTSEDLIFNGDFQEIPVKGKVLKITTKQPVTTLYCSDNDLV